MKKIYSILSLLLLCSMVAFADNRVVIANDIANNVTISGIEGNVVTLTVTPAEGKYLTDISAMKTVDASVAAPQRRTDIPVAAYTLTKTSTTADRSQEATYTMTLEDGFGAYVTATFAARTAITADQITLSAASFTYNGSDQKATVSIDGLTLDTDYTISYKETEWKDAGTYTVTITGIDSYKGTIEKTFEIQQVATEITNINLPIELFVGEDRNIGAVLTPAEAGSLVYTSDNETVATVDETGTITALSEGTATITVSFPGNKNYAAVSKTVAVTVSKISTQINVDIPPADVKFYVGDEVATGATLTPADAGILTITSSDETVAIIREGNIVAVGPGTTTITASFAGDDTYAAAESKSYELTIDLNPTSVTTNLPNTPFELWVGDTYTLVPTTTPTGLNVTYIPDNSGVVSVDENGVVTALKEGTASITVTVGGDGVYAENSTVATFTVIKIPTELDVTVNCPQTYDPMSNFLVNGTVKLKDTQYGVDKGSVDIYLNDEFKLTSNVDNKGSFSCDLGPLNAGTYKLYAKYSDESGKFDEAEWPVNTATFEIGKKSLTDNDVVVGISKVNNTYQVSVTRGKETLVEGTDYTLGEGTGQTSGSSYNYSIPVTGMGNYSGEVTATWSDAIAAYTVNVVDANNAEVSSIEVGAETTTVTIPGTVNDGTNDVPVTSIADGTFTSENTANVQSIDLSETQVDLDMDRKADGSPVKDVPENTLIYLPAGSTMTGDNVIVKEANSDNFTCENFVMTDNKSYSVPHAFTATLATLNREFTAKQTCTVCLPFNVPAAGVHGKIYTFTSVANNQVTMTEDADGLDANVPYIFVPDGTNNISTTGSIAVEIAGNNTSANDFTFKSIYEDHTFTAKEIAKGIYGFAGAKAVGTTPGHFAKAATGAYIKGMRAYLEYTGSATDPGLEGPDVSSPRYNDLDSPLPDSMNVILVDADGTTTNIGKMELMEDGETPRYNLSGQRVGKSHKGIVIENSKKMVIK